MLELGTKAYPYRSFKAVSSEILNHFSYQDVNITIYLKEGTNVYIEGDTTYFLGITSVTVTSYSDTSSDSKRALIIPTSIPQHGISERAAFHLLNHTNLPIAEKISLKNYNDVVLGKLGMQLVTFKVTETSFAYVNLDAYTEEIDYNVEKSLMFLIYLQNRDATVSKSNTDIFFRKR
jgi:hypothetical protein